MSARNLLLVSGTIDPQRPIQIAAGERPRADYFEIAGRIGADILDYGEMRRTQGSIGRQLERLSPSLALAWAAWERCQAHPLILSDGEQVGLPLALLCKASGRRPAHVMIVHVLSVGKKQLFLKLFRVQRQIDRYIVYSTWQQRFLSQSLGVPPERVLWSPFQADGRFFKPMPKVRPRRLISSAGLEFRDYPTLLEAVRGLPEPYADLQIVLAAASPWSKRSDQMRGQALPPNVTVRRFNQFDLRQVYAESAFIVVPLHDVPFQAGITTILEGMAMGKAVIVSRTAGQQDVIEEGVTGLYVPPGDPVALRAAIQQLLDHPEEAERLGQNARRVFEERFSLDVYVEGLRRICQEVLDSQAAPSVQAVEWQ